MTQSIYNLFRILNMENGVMIEKTGLNMKESIIRIKGKPFKIQMVNPSKIYLTNENRQERYESIIDVEQSTKELTDTTSNKISQNSNELDRNLSILIERSNNQDKNLMEESHEYKVGSGSYNEENKLLFHHEFELKKINDDLIKKISK